MKKAPIRVDPSIGFCNESLIGSKYEKAYRNAGALHAECF